MNGLKSTECTDFPGRTAGLEAEGSATAMKPGNPEKDISTTADITCRPKSVLSE